MELNFAFPIAIIIFLSFLIIGFTFKLSDARQELYKGDEKIRELDARVQELESLIRNLRS